MSYSLKYWNEFKNYYDETVRVEILGRSFSGTATEVKTSSTPLVISYLGSDTEIYNPIVGSQAKIKLLSETDFQFIDLHNSDSRAHRVDIYKEGVLDWTGWVLPDLFSEPYVAPPYFVEVTARCGLGELQESIIPTEITELATAPITTSQPLLYSIIGNALLSLDSDLKLNSAVNLFFDSNDYQPFPYTRINLSAYEGKSWYEAISDILLTFGARLYQMGGYWWIVRIKELRESLSYEQYTMDISGHNTSITITGKLTTFLIGRPEGSQIVNNSPTLDINPSWNSFTWNQNLGLYESILRNSNFDDFTLTSSDRENVWDFEYWDLSKSTIFGRNINRDGSFGDFASFSELAVNDNDYSNYIKQQIDNMYANTNLLSNDYGQTYTLSLTYDLLSLSTDIESAGFKFKLEINGYYLKEESGSLVWTTEDSVIVLEDIAPTYFGGRYNGGENDDPSWETSTFSISSIPTDGDMILTIYSDYRTFLRLNNASIVVTNNNGNEYSNEEETNILVDSNNIYVPNDIGIVGGDLPDVINNRSIWGNGYKTTSSQSTKEWHEKGSLVEKPLLKLIGDDYKGIYDKPQFKLSLPILSQGIKFDSCIVDYQVLPRKYVCTSADLDYQTCIFSGTFMEFAPWEDSAWILATGSWNDDGIWIDTETWKDN